MDQEFKDNCERLGLSQEDIANYGGGFQNEGTGFSKTRAELVAMDKASIQSIHNDPERMKKLAEALKCR